MSSHPPDHSRQTVSELLDDIRGLEATILYCEARVAAKWIAVNEVLGSESARREGAVAETIKAAAKPPVPSVARMLDQVLPGLNGGTVTRKELGDLIMERFPEASRKRVDKGVYEVVLKLLTMGVLMRVAGGFKRTGRKAGGRVATAINDGL